HIRAARVILASGALERPMWFANNDRPGVMSAEAALHHQTEFGAMAGRRVILATASDASYPVAQAMAAAGTDVTIVDARHDAPATPSDVRQIRGAGITAATGQSEVWGAVVAGNHMSADAILCAGGWTPTVHLWCQAGGKLDWDAARDMLVPRVGSLPASSPPIRVVGAANGTLPLDAALAEGHAAASGTGPPPRSNDPTLWAGLALRPDPSLRGRQWIDLQNDVTLKDVALAAREGYTSVEHLKRYTTLGMATDQGRGANFAGLAAMSALTGRSIPETGTTTYRPPFQPVPLSVIAGRTQGPLMNPPSRLSLEPAHRAAGAQWRDYGGWLRPSAYGTGDDQIHAQDEARIARQTAGIYDASSLGKIEVIGPNAPALLDFTGYMRMSTLPPGRARYGLMLSESGVVYDDGVVLRLDAHRFVVSASSSHTAGVRARLEDAQQDRFGRAGIYIHDVTAQWVTLTVTGPKARALMAAAGLPLPDLAHMGVTETVWNEAALRIARISFTGDASYELSVPLRHGPALHAALERARVALGAVWIGLEALMILRMEKGYIVIGKDTDGNTLPQDLGWAGPRAKRTDAYLGDRSLFTHTGAAPMRRALVGLSVDGPPLVVGSHCVPPKSDARRSLGFVTSASHSPTLNRAIALALLENGPARIGQTVHCYHDGAVRTATVTTPCVFDPKGARLHA
ncbi:MAG: glycine cleavage T C-terminal barrel domain-containing protein, partial [Primorskyibacter sp.]